MNKAKINELYEKAYVTYEVPYESSVVDPTIVSVHKQKVWDRYLFAELIVSECAGLLEKEAESSHDEGTDTYNILLKESNWMKRHFGVE